MILLVTLALYLALPAAPPPPVEDQAALADDQVNAFLKTAKDEGRMLEPLAVRSTPLPSSPTHAGDVIVAAFVDRSGGCVNAWLRLTQVIPKLGAAPARQLDTFQAAPCTKRRQPLNHFLALLDAIGKRAWSTVAEHVPGSLQFPIGLESQGKLSRKTYDREQILAGKVPFPACDPLDDTPACQSPRPSGRTTCTCSGPRHVMELDFQVDPARPNDPPQLVSIRDKVLRD